MIFLRRLADIHKTYSVISFKGHDRLQKNSIFHYDYLFNLQLLLTGLVFFSAGFSYLLNDPNKTDKDILYTRFI